MRIASHFFRRSRSWSSSARCWRTIGRSGLARTAIAFVKKASWIAFLAKDCRSSARAVALGYSGPAVANGRVYLMDYVVRSGKFTNNPDGREGLVGTEHALCLDADRGQIIWKHKYDRPYRMSYPGTRCTPTIDGDRVYALGAEGNLSCLDAATRRAVWTKDFAKDYGAWHTSLGCGRSSARRRRCAVLRGRRRRHDCTLQRRLPCPAMQNLSWGQKLEWESHLSRLIAL